MRLHPVSGGVQAETDSSESSATTAKGSQNFDDALRSAVQNPTASTQHPAAESGAYLFAESAPPATVGESVEIASPAGAPVSGAEDPARTRQAAAAYERQAASVSTPPPLSSLQKYKDDQLLRNPGGDHYDLGNKTVSEPSAQQKSFVGRIGKDLSDSFGNVKNFVGNLLFGAKELYRDEKGEIRETRRRGLAGCVKDFFKDLGSALSFGLYHPDEKEGPTGFGGRMKYFASKFKDAVVGDLVQGIPSSLNHMGANLVLAGWNLVETIPDATVGQFDAGRKFTTTVFDNGQVVIEYLTDIIPSGDAWMRVHASKLGDLQPPVLYNLKMPERFQGDDRWHTVRNTTFRKTIETIGTLLGEGITLGLIGQSLFSSNRSHRVVE